MIVAANGRPLSPVPSLCLHWRVVRRPSLKSLRAPLRQARYAHPLETTVSCGFARGLAHFERWIGALGERLKRPARKCARNARRNGRFHAAPAQRRSEPLDGETALQTPRAYRQPGRSDDLNPWMVRRKGTANRLEDLLAGRSDDLNPWMVRLCGPIRLIPRTAAAQRRSEPLDGETWLLRCV